MRFVAFTNTIPLELEERWFPILYTKFEILPDSGGQGKFRGGCGLEKRGILLGPGVLTIQERDLGMYATGVKLVKGDEFCFGSSGGGGYGHPSQRDPELVLKDVIDGYMTLQGAREDYGVSIKVIDEDTLAYEIDWDETKKLKAELAGKKFPEGLGAHQVNAQLKNIRIIREMSEEEALEDCALVRPPGW
jgi:N-methylhydantoinase B/oxoprolinase/acetone carboxylase alpha subunit